jgi:hypothetical protein
LLQSKLYIAFEAISVGQLWLLDSDVLAIAMVFGRLEKILNELELSVPVIWASDRRPRRTPFLDNFRLPTIRPERPVVS